MVNKLLENISYITNVVEDKITGNALIHTKFTWCDGLEMSLFLDITPDCIIVSEGSMLFQTIMLDNEKVNIYENINWPSEYMAKFETGLISKMIEYNNKDEFLDGLLEFINMLIKLDGIRVGAKDDV